MNTLSTTVTYGNHTIDFAALPQVSTIALLKRGLSHYLGNEQSSKVTSAKAKFEADAANAGVEFDMEGAKGTFVASAISALLDGTIGVREVTARIDPVVRRMRDIAERNVKLILKNNGIAAPKKGEKVAFPNGDEFTMAELVDRNVAKNGDALRREAEASIREDEKKAAKAAEAATKSATGESDSADALGL